MWVITGIVELDVGGCVVRLVEVDEESGLKPKMMNYWLL